MRLPCAFSHCVSTQGTSSQSLGVCVSSQSLGSFLFVSFLFVHRLITIVSWGFYVCCLGRLCLGRWCYKMGDYVLVRSYHASTPTTSGGDDIGCSRARFQGRAHSHTGQVGHVAPGRTHSHTLPHRTCAQAAHTPRWVPDDEHSKWVQATHTVGSNGRFQAAHTRSDGRFQAAHTHTRWVRTVGSRRRTLVPTVGSRRRALTHDGFQQSVPGGAHSFQRSVPGGAHSFTRFTVEHSRTHASRWNTLPHRLQGVDCGRLLASSAMRCGRGR